ncbi:GTPase [Marinobacter halodurans]|uniref:GTPase n=1 Tax=Marinobacter halodurans TaxID=2528979 RepID=A0ABY1ZQP1_9GAMM|nr:GTPase [Marinobacter halodurans]TBW56878.1 GTPase [Marinobacter halodurans]
MTLKPELTLPEQKIANLSFCDATPKAFGKWVGALPVANIGETSRQLYHAIIELNQLIIAPQQRLALLELIRHRINFVCKELSRHYLGLAIALPDKQRKIANLSQALQLHLANGYKTTLIELLDSGAIDRNRKTVATACHRIITDLGQTILRAHQLYCPSPTRSWLECHRVYRFALRNKLQDEQVEDENLMHRQSSSIADAYKRLLLLGCARPNQLRQNELVQAYELFECWTDRTACTQEATDDALFVVNMERDAAPIYASLLGPEERTGDCFGFNTVELSADITEYQNRRNEKDRPAGNALPVPSSVSENLLAHLSQAFGVLTKRNFKRIATQGELQVAVGLSAAHYYIAGEETFKTFIESGASMEDDENYFIARAKRNNDAWAGAHDAAPTGDFMPSADTPINFRTRAGTRDEGGSAPKTYRTPLINTSPGGYCVSWTSDMPPSLQAGEVLAVREQPSHPWSVAVVRWIRQLRQQGTQIGVELLAPSATPCGVRLIQKVGNSSEFLRGLLLPEVAVIGQPATLITPRLPFQQGSRIVLRQGDREDNGQLSKRISATGSISQFELRLQSVDTPTTGRSGPNTSEDEFDSLWPSL